MFNYLANLRKKPEAERRRKVFVISFVITFIIAVIWGVSLFIYKKGMPAPQHGRPANMPSLSDTFAAFGEQMKKVFKNSDTYESETVK